MVTVRSIQAKAGSEPITMLTAYNALTTGVVDKMGIDIVLVGDSMGNTALGYGSTLPMTVGDMASRTAAVAHATDDALIVADMPFLSVGIDEASSIEHHGWMLKEADAGAVKPECGPHTVELTERLVRLGIPVMTHLGLTPRRVGEIGYGRQGTDRDDTQEILNLVKAHVGTGAFSLVLEHVPASLAKQVIETISIPTIGIGADLDCGRQVLAVDDVVGMSNCTPPFATQFGDVKSEMKKAVDAYRDAVEAGEFPADGHSHIKDDLDELY